MIEEVIYKLYEGITWEAYPGNHSVNGCFPVNAQKNVDFPFIVYEVLEREPSPTKDSPDSALDIFSISIMTYADNYTDAKLISNIFKQNLDSIVNHTTVSNTLIQSVRYQGTDSDYAEEIEGYMTNLLYKIRVDRTEGGSTSQTTVPNNLLSYILPVTL